MYDFCWRVRCLFVTDIGLLSTMKPPHSSRIVIGNLQNSYKKYNCLLQINTTIKVDGPGE